jgi:5,10-methylenetetrahydromethanopterin reductase
VWRVLKTSEVWRKIVTRTGFATGYDPTLSIPEMANWIRKAEERGYEIGFFSETIGLVRDSVTAVSVFAANTSRITLGFTQVVRLRTPVIMAQTLASLDELSNGRIILAPGACTRAHAERHSLEHIDPVLTLTEWVGAIRGILAEERATFKGEVVDLENVGLSWRPPRRHIPFWNAATSQTGLRLAGKIGDGVLLNAIASPEYSANAIAILKEAVAEAGKDWEEFEVAQLINCSVEDDRGAAYDQIRWEVASKFEPIQMPFNAGPRLRVGEPHIKEQDLPMFEAAYAGGGKASLMEAFPESYIAGLTASGTPSDVVEKVQAYRDAGVKLPILRPAAQHQTQRLLDLFAPR